MTQWLMAALRRRRTAPVPHADALPLASMPEHLLYDIGMSRDGVPSLARQLRCGGGERRH